MAASSSRHLLPTVGAMTRLASTSFTRRVMCLFAVGGLTIACADGVRTNGLFPADLLLRAENGETVRVIVEFKAGAEDIHAVQELVLEAIAGTRHRVTRQYQAVPFLALEVSAEALRRLMQSPVVRRIQEDRAVSPQENIP
jgi:hypothetical protein